MIKLGQFICHLLCTHSWIIGWEVVVRKSPISGLIFLLTSCCNCMSLMSQTTVNTLEFWASSYSCYSGCVCMCTYTVYDYNVCLCNDKTKHCGRQGVRKMLISLESCQISFNLLFTYMYFKFPSSFQNVPQQIYQNVRVPGQWNKLPKCHIFSLPWLGPICNLNHFLKDGLHIYFPR